MIRRETRRISTERSRCSQSHRFACRRAGHCKTGAFVPESGRRHRARERPIARTFKQVVERRSVRRLRPSLFRPLISCRHKLPARKRSSSSWQSSTKRAQTLRSAAPLSVRKSAIVLSSPVRRSRSCEVLAAAIESNNQQVTSHADNVSRKCRKGDSKKADLGPLLFDAVPMALGWNNQRRQGSLRQ